MPVSKSFGAARVLSCLQLLEKSLGSPAVQGGHDDAAASQQDDMQDGTGHGVAFNGINVQASDLSDPSCTHSILSLSYSTAIGVLTPVACTFPPAVVPCK